MLHSILIPILELNTKSGFPEPLFISGHSQRDHSMQTEELIRLLVARGGPTKSSRIHVQYLTGIGLGAIGTLALMLMALNIRTDIAAALFLPKFQLKLALLISLVGASLIMLTRLARPGCVLGRTPLALVAPLAALWLFSVESLFRASPSERAIMLLGSTWRTCSISIAILSLPVFLVLVWITKNLAPTRLRLSGAVAGFLSGSVAALVYSLHCTEMSLPFIGTWYVLGILIPTGVGTILGRYLLHW